MGSMLVECFRVEDTDPDPSVAGPGGGGEFASVADDRRMMDDDEKGSSGTERLEAEEFTYRAAGKSASHERMTK